MTLNRVKLEHTVTCMEYLAKLEYLPKYFANIPFSLRFITAYCKDFRSV